MREAEERRRTLTEKKKIKSRSVRVGQNNLITRRINEKEKQSRTKVSRIGFENLKKYVTRPENNKFSFNKITSLSKFIFYIEITLININSSFSIFSSVNLKEGITYYANKHL